LSLQALADSIPLSASFLSDIENGRSNPSIKRLEEIAVALNTTIAYLIDGNTIDPKSFPETFHADPVFSEIVDRLNGFDGWAADDKTELLMYMRAKETIRQSKKS
jgi:transcriptional regulator with XRE-family HTH domain